MKVQRRIVVISVIVFLLFLAFAVLTYFVMWQHTSTIQTLESQVFEVTGNYPQFNTYEIVELIWASFYVFIPITLIVLLFNAIKVMRKFSEMQTDIMKEY